MPAVQSEAPNSTARAFSQAVTVMFTKSYTPAVNKSQRKRESSRQTLVRQPNADPSSLRQLEDDSARRDVLDRQANGLEDRQV